MATPLVTRTNETGNVTEYDGTVISGAGSTCLVDTTSVLTGTYGLHASGAGSTNGTGWAYANFTPVANSGNYVEITYDFKLVSSLPTGVGTVQFGHLRREGTIFSPVAWIAYDFTAGWQLGVRGKDGANVGTNLSTAPAVGTWCAIRIVYNATGANPVITLYKDGSSVATYTDTTTGTIYVPNQMRLGGAETQWTVAWECYTDNGKAYDTDSTAVAAPTPLLMLLGVG
jgi:hypothetical protein